MLGIREQTQIKPEEMASRLKLTFFPYDEKKISKNILDYTERLRNTLNELSVNIVPYNEAIEVVSMWKILDRLFKILTNNLFYIPSAILGNNSHYFFINFQVFKNLIKRKRIRKGISVIALGENDTGNLPVDNTSSFQESSVITILDRPSNITNESNFYDHFNTAMNLFAYNMTNIVIVVDADQWILYNFNASHPTYEINKNFKQNVLYGLLPKIFAPIKPLQISNFFRKDDSIDINDSLHAPLVKDLVEGGKLFGKTSLYPKGKNIDELPFRNDFYRWIGKIHLDHRNGMSYGFLSRQMPTALSKLLPLENMPDNFREKIQKDKDYFLSEDGKIFLIVELNSGKFYIKVPDVWVLSQRSGSDKTNMNPKKDLVKLGLIDGKYYLQTPIGLKLTSDYKPSFDTQAILAHALGNAIVASILEHERPGSLFAEDFKKQGLAITHWHGYIDPTKIQKGWFVHGENNPNVSCSSPQSAIYAFLGKYNVFLDALKNNIDYKGDIHIEPHHGINIVSPDISSLANFLLENSGASVLGSKYLRYYTED